MISHDCWASIGNVDDIPAAGSRVVVSPGCRIAVFRTEDNKIFALEDRCPHRMGPISQGIVHGDKVTCPLHNLVINLTDGTASDDGCTPVCTISVQVGEGGEVLLNTEDIRAMQESGTG